MLVKPELKIDWASHDATRYACLNWHYSKCLPVGKLVKVGVWEDSKFIGVILFGRGANKNLGKPYGLTQIECVELVRIALKKHQTPVSKIVSIALKFFRKLNETTKLVISFSDTEQNHHGGIYQAGNWIYTGLTNLPAEYFYKGKRWHTRAFHKSHGSHLNFIDKGLQILKGSKKHRYLMPLDDGLKSKVLLLAKPYPKRVKQAMIGSLDTAKVQHLSTRSNV